MTPSQIAKEAAELILGNALLPGGEVRMNLNMDMAKQVILAAAAKIVKESGADLRTMSVEYIESGTFCGGEEDAYNFDARDKTEFVVIRASALSALRALTETGET